MVTLPAESVVQATGVVLSVVTPPHWLAGRVITSPLTRCTIDRYKVAPGTQSVPSRAWANQVADLPPRSEPAIAIGSGLTRIWVNAVPVGAQVTLGLFAAERTRTVPAVPPMPATIRVPIAASATRRHPRAPSRTGPSLSPALE